MTDELLRAFGFAAGTAVVVAAMSSRLPAPRSTNYRGVELPVVLGVAFVAGSLAGYLASAGDVEWGIAGGAILLLIAGRLDDARAGRARGIRGHLGALARGRLTTGIVKILAGFAAAGLALAGLGGGVGRLVLGVLVIAGATNVWNVLDVAPGRALKWFVPVQAALLAAAWNSPHVPLLAAALGAALATLPFDLRERGMLGDAGSNPLGFMAGVALYVALPTPALAIALVVVLSLQFLAETVTLTRVIESVPPLRWYERLGRVVPRGSATYGPG